MRLSLLAVLLAIGGSIFAEEEKSLTCDLVPFHRSKDGTVYRLLVTNASGEPILLGAVPRRFRKTISWDRTDTYYSSSTESGPAWIYPASYAEITGKDGKTILHGGEEIRKAIQHPTGSENSFCTIHPGKSISCEYPILDRKPERAVFYFLKRRGEKSEPVHVTWRADQPPVATWVAATGHAIPGGDSSRTRLYEVPFAVFGTQEPDLPIIQGRRKIFDLKPWCEQNGLAGGEIDLAFYDPRTGFCLISTSEANHFKLKELQFEPH